MHVSSIDDAIGEPVPLQRSERAPSPTRRDENYIWTLPSGSTPQAHDDTTSAEPVGETVAESVGDTVVEPVGANAARSGVGSGFFASTEDVALTVKQLARSGMTLEAVAMAFVSQSVESEPATTPHNTAATNMRPIVMALAVISEREPRSMIEISRMDEPEKTRWRQAAQEEYDALMKNETWELVPRPPGRRVTRCKWVFKLKRGGDGEVIRYKGRLVAQGFTQQHGVDYHETWAPTMNPVSMRTVLGIGNAKAWRRLKQADVPNAYLKATLKHEVLMEQAPGFVVEGKEDWVYRLLRALYGLKQAGREWNEQITDKLVNQWGYTQSRTDGCVFSRRDAGGLVVLIGLYVDSIFGAPAWSPRDPRRV